MMTCADDSSLRQVMTVEGNKQIVLEFLTAVAQGRGREVLSLCEPDATWWINGSFKLSGSHRIEELLTTARDLYAGARRVGDLSIGAITAEDDRVCIEARTVARFDDGRVYDNQAHLLVTLSNGKIRSVREYLDTDQTVRVLLSKQTQDQSPKTVARRLYEDVVGRNDTALLDELVASDAIDYNAERQSWPAGREGFRRHVAFFHGVFSNLEVSIDDLVEEGERVVAFWTLRGTHSGELWGIPPTGRRVVVSTISILRMQGGQVVEYESRPDRLGLLLQLGGFGIYQQQVRETAA